MDKLDWFNPRGYLHFDVPVKAEYAAALCSETVAAHAWSPLIHYVKVEKRYKSKEKKTQKKERNIMYASHRDACILSKYSAELVRRLDRWYIENELNDAIVAYRALGRSNYHFAKRAEDFVRSHSPLTVMCFDVTGFFDNLNHKRLKSRLKWILGCSELDRDWYAVFNNVTRFKYVTIDDLKKNDDLAKRLKNKRSHPLVTIQKIKSLGIPIHKNPKDVGIPQGTPIRVRTHKQDSHGCRDVIHLPLARRHHRWRISSGFQMSSGRGSSRSCRPIRAGCRGSTIGVCFPGSSMR